MGISSLVYDSWMKEIQFRKFEGILPMLSHVPPKAKAVDVGIGTGLFEEFLANKGVYLEVKGVEIDPKMLEEARKKGFDVVTASAEQLPFDESSFDLTVCLDVLHATNAERAMNELVRVTRPRGFLLISMVCNVFNKNEISARLAGLTEGLEVVEKKFVGHADRELSLAMLCRRKG
jgi:ubiquinone/menaquinone biosynthesis C-methylase UbiE